MAFSSNKSGGPMAEINVTPLVDVMLVLLIIFMITAPAVTNRILIDVPQKSTQPPPKDPPPTSATATTAARCSTRWSRS